MNALATRVSSRDRRAERGMTLVELAVSTVVLLVGAVAAMQLVPAAMQSNLNNRFDSSSMVIAQRLLDQMVSRPLTDWQFTDGDGRVIQLGSPAAASDTVQGGPVRVIRRMTQIDFNATAVPAYNLRYLDPNDPTRTPYEIRWAVITTLQGSMPIAKRFIVGAWRRDRRGATAPVTVEAWVQR